MLWRGVCRVYFRVFVLHLRFFGASLVWFFFFCGCGPFFFVFLGLFAVFIFASLAVCFVFGFFLSRLKRSSVLRVVFDQQRGLGCSIFFWGSFCLVEFRPTEF